MPLRNLVAQGILILIFLLPLSAAAQTANSDQEEILFSADEVTHDRELGIIKASGNVEIVRGDQILLAETISYNQRQNIVTASGNINFLQPNGDVLFADFMEISGDFKDGVVRNIRILLSDNSRIAATGGRRSGGERLDMRNAVYTPCESCATDPTRAPLWQVKAKRVVHDQPNQVIEYADAWLEFMGTPVAYTPFFFHPDPTVKRRSGFLTPSFGTSSTLGSHLTVPYYYAPTASRDMTISPTFTTKERIVLAGQYRERFEKGTIDTDASATYDSESTFRGHIDLQSKYNLNQTWRAGADVARSTDDTYQRRYGFKTAKSLTSRGYLEGFRRRNYMALNAYAYQDTEESADPGQTPLVLPYFEYQHVGEASWRGLYQTIDASLLSVTRSEGTDTRRLSVGGGWHLPFVSPIGDVYKLSATVRGDLYHIDDLSRPNAGNFDGVSGRVYPQLTLDWRYPWSRQDGRVNQIIEPIASFSVSPYGGNPTDISNEDSVDVEFDDTNLMAASRFSGIDRVEGGPRVNYGLKWGVYGAGGGGTSVFFGQSYRFKADDTFANGTGLSDNFSDIVGRINVNPGKFIDLTYRTRIDKDNLRSRRNEFQFTGGPRSLNVSTSYTFFDSEDESEFPDREEISASVDARLSRFWRTGFSVLHDVDAEDLRRLSWSLAYEDECFIFSSILQRQFFEDRDLKPEDSILFRLTFKTLGDVRTNVSASAN